MLTHVTCDSIYLQHRRGLSLFFVNCIVTVMICLNLDCQRCARLELYIVFAMHFAYQVTSILDSECTPAACTCRSYSYYCNLVRMICMLTKINVSFCCYVYLYSTCTTIARDRNICEQYFCELPIIFLVKTDVVYMIVT